MKKRKLLLFIIAIVLSITLIACNKDNDDPTCLENQTLVEGVCVDDELEEDPNLKYDFSEDTVSTKTEVIESVVFYKGKLEGFAGVEDEVAKHSGLTNLSEDILFYTREDFTKYDDPNHIDYPAMETESLINTLMTVYLLRSVIDKCAEFVEGEFCTVGEENNRSYKIKMQVMGDKLFIEAYGYSADIDNSYYSIDAEIMFFDLIDGLVYFEYVRDNHGVYDGEVSHDLYFEEFLEGTSTTSTALYDSGNVHYQYFNADGSEHLRFRSGENESYISYRDSITEMYYFTKYDLEGKLTFSSLAFLNGYKEDFRYRFNIPEYDSILVWNILETTGWDKVGILEEFPYDTFLYNDDIEILTEFDFFGAHDDVEYIYGTLEIIDENITQDLIDLSLYGLSFSKVTLEDINREKLYLEENYLEFKALYGFDGEAEDDWNGVYNMFRFFADEEIVSELEAMLILQLAE